MLQKRVTSVCLEAKEHLPDIVQDLFLQGPPEHFQLPLTTRGTQGEAARS